MTGDNRLDIAMFTYNDKLSDPPYIPEGLNFTSRCSNNCIHPRFYKIIKFIIKIGMIEFKIKHHFQEKKYWAFHDKTKETRLGWHP